MERAASLLEISLLEIVYDVYSIRIGNENIEQTTPATLERLIK